VCCRPSIKHSTQVVQAMLRHKSHQCTTKVFCRRVRSSKSTSFATNFHSFAYSILRGLVHGALSAYTQTPTSSLLLRCHLHLSREHCAVPSGYDTPPLHQRCTGLHSSSRTIARKASSNQTLNLSASGDSRATRNDVHTTLEAMDYEDTSLMIMLKL
jgi:hypothetical protein